MAWSDDPSQGYLTKTGIQNIKSVLTNDIFKQEMLFLYEQKSISRDELVREARRTMSRLAQNLIPDSGSHPELEQLIGELAQRLETVRGKKQYGYLPKYVKRLVDEIVRQLERLPAVAECYDKWWQLNERVRGYYTGETREKPPLSQQKESLSIKNAIIYEAERIREFIPDTEISAQNGGAYMPPAATAVARLIGHLSRIFQDNPVFNHAKPGLRIDSKRRRKLMEKKQALGLREEHDIRME